MVAPRAGDLIHEGSWASHVGASWPRDFVGYTETEERSIPSFFILLRRVFG